MTVLRFCLTLWEPETGLALRDLLIFVEESAEPVVSSDSGSDIRSVFWERT
jgi:hypothetical protein